MISRTHDRTFVLEFPGKSLETPFFFPAISSIRTNLPPLEYLKLLHAIGYPGFLISAYDIHRADTDAKKHIRETLAESDSKGGVILLDSGNYEAFWNCDNRWKLGSLRPVLKDIDVDLCLSFDCFWEHSKRTGEHIKETKTLISKTAGMQRAGITVPIIHSDPKHFPSIIGKISDSLNPEIIAVPERELGLSLFHRAQTVKDIRDELDKRKMDTAIHLLGTGNPISMLIYTLAGADMFDGLEWCKTVVNPSTAHLYHFVQKELVDCSCRACNDTGLPYHTRTMIHNLLFYSDYTKRIRTMLQKEQINALLQSYLPRKAAQKIKEIAGLK